MKQIKFLIALFMPILLAGCIHNSKLSDDVGAMAAGETFVFDGDAHDFKLSDITKCRNAILLDTPDDDALLGNIQRIIQCDSMFLFADDMNHVIAFNSVGKKLFSIHNVGQGPGEYTYLRDIAIDHNSHRLLLLDDNKILAYSTDGKFTGDEYSFNHNVSKLAIANGINYFLINTYAYDKQGKWNVCTTTDLNGPLTYYLNALKEYAPHCTFLGSFLNNSKSAGITLTRKFDSVIYQLNESSYTKFMEIDWGKSKFTPQINHTYDCSSLANETLTSRQIYAMFNWQFSDSICTFSTNVPGLYVANRSDHRVIRVEAPRDSELNIPLFNALPITESDGLIAFMVGYSSIETYAKLPNMGNEKLDELLNYMTSDSNPLMIIYKLK